MNGLTISEMKMLATIRTLAAHDLATAKRIASKWVRENPRRRGLRTVAAHSVKSLYDHRD
jgi:hypothetical protein